MIEKVFLLPNEILNTTGLPTKIVIENRVVNLVRASDNAMIFSSTSVFNAIHNCKKKSVDSAIERFCSSAKSATAYWVSCS